MLEAIDRIEKYTRDGRPRFESEELVQSWAIHHLEIIGEAAGTVTAGTRAMAPEIAWASISGMRNVLAHRYFGIDLDAVWSAVQNDLPVLKGEIEALLRKLPPEAKT
jgi:uncharacterized protein with HEPN domain